MSLLKLTILLAAVILDSVAYGRSIVNEHNIVKRDTWDHLEVSPNRADFLYSGLQVTVSWRAYTSGFTEVTSNNRPINILFARNGSNNTSNTDDDVFGLIAGGVSVPGNLTWTIPKNLEPDNNYYMPYMAPVDSERDGPDFVQWITIAPVPKSVTATSNLPFSTASPATSKSAGGSTATTISSTAPPSSTGTAVSSTSTTDIPAKIAVSAGTIAGVAIACALLVFGAVVLLIFAKRANWLRKDSTTVAKAQTLVELEHAPVYFNGAYYQKTDVQQQRHQMD